MAENLKLYNPSTSSMGPLEIRPATRDDAPRIAEIHMAAFGRNAMLLAQFPTPAVRVSLQRSIELKALADIDDPKTTVLVVRDSQQQSETKGGEAIAFAKWAHPVYDTKDYVEPPWIWPEGTDYGVLDAWTKETEVALERVLGSDPCYRLTFIGTDPSHERRGAGSLLVRWGVERSKSDRVPIYLESTVESAPFYKGLGFTAEETVSLQLSAADGDRTDVYEEIIFTFRSW